MSRVSEIIERWKAISTGHLNDHEKQRAAVIALSEVEGDTPLSEKEHEELAEFTRNWQQNKYGPNSRQQRRAAERMKKRS